MRLPDQPHVGDAANRKEEPRRQPQFPGDLRRPFPLTYSLPQVNRAGLSRRAVRCENGGLMLVASNSIKEW